MKKTYKKAFTLIELLIVIAIIGILASVVLVSLNSARQKAEVASWKSTVGSTYAGAVMCCSDTAGLSGTAGSAMCPGGANWPAAADLGGLAVDATANCSVGSDFTYTITPTAGSDVASQCGPATCTQNGCTFTPFDATTRC